MTTRRLTRFVMPLLLLTAALLGACTTVVREPARERVVVREMPAPVAEVIAASPGVGWNWVPGHWAWRDGGWRWSAGRWVQTVVVAMPPPRVEVITVAPSPAHFWVRGHWRWGGAGWVWANGSWVF